MDPTRSRSSSSASYISIELGDGSGLDGLVQGQSAVDVLPAGGGDGGEPPLGAAQGQVVLDLSEIAPSPSNAAIMASMFKWLGMGLFMGDAVAGIAGAPSLTTNAMGAVGSAGFMAGGVAGLVGAWSSSDRIEKAIKLVGLLGGNIPLVVASLTAFCPVVPATAIAILKVIGLTSLSLAILTGTGRAAIQAAKDQGRLTKDDVLKLLSGISCGFSLGGFAGVIASATGGVISHETASWAIIGLMGLMGISASIGESISGLCDCPPPSFSMEDETDTSSETRSLLGAEAGASASGYGSTASADQLPPLDQSGVEDVVCDFLRRMP